VHRTVAVLVNVCIYESRESVTTVVLTVVWRSCITGFTHYPA